MAGFNSSLWHVLWVLVPLGFVVFIVAYVTLNGKHFYFDPKDGSPTLTGDFEHHSARYQDLAKLVITLSAGGIAFLISVMANEKPPLSAFDQKVEAVAPIVVGFFAACIACLIIFMVTQTVWYEQYSHSAKRDTYYQWKYALCSALGWTGLLSFVIGFVWLARNLF
jgi:hypothetical protein